MTYKLTIEGWRFLPHSYSIINQFQCLEFLRREKIELFHQDFPYHKDTWVPHEHLFSPVEELALSNISSPAIDQLSDVTLRISYPFCLESSKSKRTYVFITSEESYIDKQAMWLDCSLAEALKKFDIVLITPSNWSKNGLINSGADPNRIEIVPHGIDPNIYKPLLATERLLLRKQFGFENDFVFLNIGAMSINKRIDLVLKSFAKVLEKYPNSRLVLKGIDSIHSSREGLIYSLKNFLTEEEARLVIDRLTYIGVPLPFNEIAKLYQIADAYVSPYGAEGFNLPVLEAAASGLPIICTDGGSTDDFVNSDFALRIESQLVTPDWNDEAIWLSPSVEHLIELMYYVIEKDSFRIDAQVNGASFVHQNFTWSHVVDKLLDVFKLD